MTAPNRDISHDHQLVPLADRNAWFDAVYRSVATSPEYIGIPEIAALTGLSAEALHCRKTRNRLPFAVAVRVRRSIYFPRADALNWVNEQRERKGLGRIPSRAGGRYVDLSDYYVAQNAQKSPRSGETGPTHVPACPDDAGDSGALEREAA